MENEGWGCSGTIVFVVLCESDLTRDGARHPSLVPAKLLLRDQIRFVQVVYHMM